MLEAGYAAPEMAGRGHKLAELIVRECANLCDEYQDIPATEPRHCAQDIRSLFGVKE
jgi:hypothetical protein